MSLLTSLRLRVVDWLTGWLPDPYQPAAFAEQDDDDVLSDCGMADGERRLIGAVMQAQAEQAAAFEARTDLTESRRMWADLDECAYLADAERCHHCPPSVCNGVPERKTLAEDQTITGGGQCNS